MSAPKATSQGPEHVAVGGRRHAEAPGAARAAAAPRTSSNARTSRRTSARAPAISQNARAKGSLTRRAPFTPGGRRPLASMAAARSAKPISSVAANPTIDRRKGTGHRDEDGRLADRACRPGGRPRAPHACGSPVRRRRMPNATSPSAPDGPQRLADELQGSIRVVHAHDLHHAGVSLRLHAETRDDAAMTGPWDERAEAYRTSPTHREGARSRRPGAVVRPGAGVEALDVATGGGHVARRLAEAGCEVTTCDAAAGMRPDVVCPAEALAFADSSFDVVACRIAAHHFTDVAAAVREMARVSRRLVVIEDTLYADERVEEAERLRDPTHVRSYTEAEWRDFLTAAGCTVERVGRFPKRHPVEPWLGTGGMHRGDRRAGAHAPRRPYGRGWRGVARHEDPAARPRRLSGTALATAVTRGRPSARSPAAAVRRCAGAAAGWHPWRRPRSARRGRGRAP